MTTASVAGSQSWYRSLDANQWKTMIASNLGWAFDGYETFSLILVVGVALHDLLDPSQFAQIPAFAGTVIGITLLGWGIGVFFHALAVFVLSTAAPHRKRMIEQEVKK